MANELSDFKIIDAISSGEDFVIHPSDFTCYNELSYITSPSRDNNFELNNSDIVSKYIPKITFTIPALKESDYKTLIVAVNKTSFKVEYYDIEILQKVVRTFYCSSKSYEKMSVLSNGEKMAVNVKMEFVCVYSYADYSELKTASPALVSGNYALTARIYFANPTGAQINTIVATGGISPTSTFQGGSYSASTIGNISLGSRILLYGTPFDDSIFGNTYSGMILTASRSSETISTSNDYEMTSSTSIDINMTTAGKVYIRFDFTKNLYATRFQINRIDYTNDNALIEVNLDAGDNIITFTALNMPKEYVRISTITTSLVVDYSTTNFLTDLTFDVSATSEVGKAQYGFNLASCNFTIYDKSGIISQLAANNTISNDTKVELYMNEKGNSIKSSDKIAFMSIDTYEYVDSSYNKKIRIDLKDTMDNTNNIKVLSNDDTSSLQGAGADIYDMIVMLLYRGNYIIDSTFSSCKSFWRNITDSYMLNTSYTLYQMLSYFSNAMTSYTYSDGNGSIKRIGGQ